MVEGKVSSDVAALEHGICVVAAKGVAADGVDLDSALTMVGGKMVSPDDSALGSVANVVRGKVTEDVVLLECGRRVVLDKAGSRAHAANFSTSAL